jgi:hypothetical protein
MVGRQHLLKVGLEGRGASHVILEGIHNDLRKRFSTIRAVIEPWSPWMDQLP